MMLGRSGVVLVALLVVGISPYIGIGVHWLYVKEVMIVQSSPMISYIGLGMKQWTHVRIVILIYPIIEIIAFKTGIVGEFVIFSISVHIRRRRGRNT